MYSNRNRTPGALLTLAAPLLGMLLLGILASCASMTPTSVPTQDPNGVTITSGAVVNSAWDGFCAVAKAIPWDTDDTDDTIVAIKEHNHLGALHCGWPE